MVFLLRISTTCPLMSSLAVLILVKRQHLNNRRKKLGPSMWHHVISLLSIKKNIKNKILFIDA